MGGGVIVDALVAQLLARRDRPVSVAVTAHAIFVPGALIVFLAKPGLYQQIGIGGVILLSVAISFPIVLLCFALWYSFMSAFAQIQLRLADTPTVVPLDIPTALNTEDRFEWPCLLAGGWSANLILYVIVAFAYHGPIRIGATFLLCGTVLAGLWFLQAAGLVWLSLAIKKRLKKKADADEANAAFLASLGSNVRKSP